MGRRLAIILVVGATLLVLAERFGPGGLQRRGSAELRAFRGRVDPAVAADPRFAQVVVHSRTQPALWVTGIVADVAARRDLEAIVRPLADAGFGFHFEVDVASATRPATQPAPHPPDDPRLWP
jgi:hypothetical protein